MGGEKKVGPDTKKKFLASVSCKTKWASFFLRVLPSLINRQAVSQPTSCRMKPEEQLDFTLNQ